MKNLIVLFSLLLSLLLPTISNAQMFSVKNKQSKQQLGGTFITGGIRTMNFSYIGGNTDPIFSRFEMSGAHMYVLQADFGVLTLQLGRGWNQGPNENLDIFMGELQGGGRYRLFRKKGIQVNLPVGFFSAVTQIQNDQRSRSDIYDISSLGFYIGPELKLKPVHWLETHHSATYQFGFATQSFGLENGTRNGFHFKNIISTFRFLERYSWVIGVDYQYQKLNVAGETFDYTLSSWLFTTGLRF